MKKVFIDGKSGTTGLRIYERLAARTDIELVVLPEELRKDVDAKKKVMNEVDAVFLCLPDAAAIESASLVNPDVVVLDTSTAHRTDANWVYGMPELNGQAERIAKSKRIAVPGCHASGFIALVAPLVEAGLLGRDAQLCCHSVTGYSGGGKKMIAEYESEGRDGLLDAPRQYALKQTHKHLPEMTAMTGLTHSPIFCPIVSDFYSGMVTTVPLFASQLKGSIEDVKKLYKNIYKGAVTTYFDNSSEEGFFSAAGYTGKDSMQITVEGSEERILLLARYDNLGKGSSGAAIECLNLAFGQEITNGLTL